MIKNFQRWWLVSIVYTTLCIAAPRKVFAWGPDGHEIVGQLAMHFATPEAQSQIREILGTMSIRDAANWMDSMRSNRRYDFMKPWHYIDFAKDKQYEPSTEENIVNRILIVVNELRHKDVLCAEQIKMDVLILFHLLGDLHQPLHTGYDDDLGGNKVAVQFDTIKTNLHHFWDEDIIRLQGITVASCLAYYRTMGTSPFDTISGIHPVRWMKENRQQLSFVYDYPDFILSGTYVKQAGTLIQHRLVLAGMRLAAILNTLFYVSAPVMSFEKVTATYKNGIFITALKDHIGKKVTVCERVYGIKSTDKVTFVNIGDAYPKSPLTVVIFAKDRGAFPGSIEELFRDRNICVEGELVEYKGKAEIIVAKPEQITVL